MPPISPPTTPTQPFISPPATLLALVVFPSHRDRHGAGGAALSAPVHLLASSYTRESVSDASSLDSDESEPPKLAPKWPVSPPVSGPPPPCTVWRPPLAHDVIPWYWSQ